MTGAEREELPLVTVVMPVRNEAAFIERSLGSVLAQDYPAERIEVLVADGRSTDDTRAQVEAVATQRDAPPVRLIDNPGGIVPTGLNAALREARGDVVVRVDGHCEVAPDHVRRCVELLAASGAACVGGPIETVGEGLWPRAIAVAMSSRFGVGNSSFRVGVERPVEVDTLAFGAYRREALELAGPFDEELVRNQDDEYNYRLRGLGERLLLDPAIRSRYYSRATLESTWRQYRQYGYWKVRVLQKHPRQMGWRQFVPPAFVAALLTALGSVPWASTPALVVAGAWLAAALLSAVGGAIRGKDAWLLLALPPAFATLHLAYGVGFLQGLFAFAGRWGDRQGRLPADWSLGPCPPTR